VNVKILRVKPSELVNATIRKGQANELPSMQQNWRFNFDKLNKKLPNSTSYVLVADEEPDEIQGCLIFQMKDKSVPYMAYVEVAPNNRTDPKKYKYVAGCLIAFAYKQSLILGKGDYKGLLSFDVQEENTDDQLKLMVMYCRDYKAVRVDETTMYIMDDAGDELVEKYLKRK